jgi:hypothetical protein
MRRQNRFLPECLVPLEVRAVPTHGGTTRGLSVVVSGLAPRQQVLNSHQQPVIAEVNQAFASFTGDYDSARATYFASIQNVPDPTPATTMAFSLYTKQRVSLLAQQIISSFLQSPQGTARAKGQSPALEQLVATKIINPSGQDPKGSLARSLVQTIPPPNTSAATASLYSLSQDEAIQAAQAAVINGVNIVKNGDFGNQTSHTGK